MSTTTTHDQPQTLRDLLLRREQLEADSLRIRSALQTLEAEFLAISDELDTVNAKLGLLALGGGKKRG